MIYVWIAVFIISVIVEIATVQLVSIWFAAGALAAFAATLCGAEQIWVQLMIFVIVSFVALAVTRPLVKRLTKRSKPEPTNADMYIGLEGVVIQDVDNLSATGLVSVRSTVWSAKSVSGEVIKKDSLVRVISIEGVKLCVEKIN